MIPVDNKKMTLWETLEKEVKEQHYNISTNHAKLHRFIKQDKELPVYQAVPLY
jgi:hypothetical protein